MVSLKGRKRKEVEEFKYLGTLVAKYMSMEGERWERVVKVRQAIGSCERITIGRNGGMLVKRKLRNCRGLPTVILVSETKAWNESL